MKLYYMPGACSLSPHIALREAGIAVDLVKVDTVAGRTASGDDYRAINPHGYVPLLELDDGTRLREGPAILQYVADQAPLKNLAPANGTLPRYRLQEWLTFTGMELHRNFGPLFNPAFPAEAKAISKDKLLSRLQWVDGQLADKTWVMGDTFSAADAYLFTVTGWAKPMQIDLAPYPNLTAWRERVGARPAVQAAMRAEGLLR